jgi:hypothetical protein
MADVTLLDHYRLGFCRKPPESVLDGLIKAVDAMRRAA